jgi:hypothetical protein
MGICFENPIRAYKTLQLTAGRMIRSKIDRLLQINQKNEIKLGNRYRTRKFTLNFKYAKT